MTFIEIGIHIIPTGIRVKWKASSDVHLQYSEDYREAKEF